MKNNPLLVLAAGVLTILTVALVILAGSLLLKNNEPKKDDTNQDQNIEPTPTVEPTPAAQNITGFSIVAEKVTNNKYDLKVVDQNEDYDLYSAEFEITYEESQISITSVQQLKSDLIFLENTSAKGNKLISLSATGSNVIPNDTKLVSVNFSKKISGEVPVYFSKAPDFSAKLVVVKTSDENVVDTSFNEVTLQDIVVIIK